VDDLIGNVTSVILAGGRSTRFGSDKRLARWRGRSLVDHVLERLPGTDHPPRLVMREEQDPSPWPNVDVIFDDPSRSEGPLRGVISGLAACTTGWAWVIACDQPMVNPDILKELFANAREDDLALIPEWAGRLQPLTGLYAVSTGALLKECADAGEHSLIGALKTIGFRIFPEEDCRRVDPPGTGFLNINRPDQLELLEGLEP
jgi:molybdopterin-guanine dinucleotide biosynthesis protein A